MDWGVCARWVLRSVLVMPKSTVTVVTATMMIGLSVDQLDGTVPATSCRRFHATYVQPTCHIAEQQRS